MSKESPIDLSDLQALEANPPVGAPSLLQALIEQYCADAPELIHRLTDACRRHDGDALRHAAHALRGASGHFKAEQAIQLCYDIEDQSGRGDWSSLEALVRQLTQHMPEVLDAMRETLQGQGGSRV